MPIVHIDIRRGHSPEYKRAILDGVHAALVEAFKSPDHDRDQTSGLPGRICRAGLNEVLVLSAGQCTTAQPQSGPDT